MSEALRGSVVSDWRFENLRAEVISMVTVTWLWKDLSLRFWAASFNTEQQTSLRSHYQISLRDETPGLSHFQFKILFDTRFDDKPLSNDVTLSGPAVEHLFKMAATDAEFWASLETNFSG